MGSTRRGQPLVEIPVAAWSWPIGGKCPRLSRPRVSEPMIDDGPIQGLPLGGLGAGTIGRTYNGDFARWHLQIGRHKYEPRPANQFSVFMESGKERIAQVLWPGRPAEGLEAWRWGYPCEAGRYYALYPRAWYDYTWDGFPARLTLTQFSPVIPHRYRESSYPVAVFKWTAYNPTRQPVTVSIMMTWENLVGWPKAQTPVTGHFNEVRSEGVEGGRLVGVVLSGPSSGKTLGSWALASQEVPGVEVTYHARFQVEGNGHEIWTPFSQDGRLANQDDLTPSDSEELIGAAIAVRFTLAPEELLTVPMVLTWDLPVVEFGSGVRWYKRYTEWFGTEGQRAWAIAKETLEHYAEWEAAIQAWQQPILADPRKPDWYKSALFNELYYLADGGTAWVKGQPDDPHAPERFGILESFDYPFYETLDVRFYSSFPLIMLWPHLENLVMRTFIPTVDAEDSQPWRIRSSGEIIRRKVPGAVPHDLGEPDESPWLKVNAFTWQDTNRWKDLNSKFVLLVYRDALLSGDWSLVEEAWPAVQAALDYLKEMDRDGDGLPENEGFPDQTYDTWSMLGPSAYCAGLWLAALEAAAAMAGRLGDKQARDQYLDWLKRGRSSFEVSLWNGNYYRYDASPQGQADSIMADQLAGQWHAEVLELPDIVPPSHIRSVLETIYQLNVLGFADGEMGAVNAVRPNGQVDRVSPQSQEVWTGTTYALAAFMLHEGMVEEALRTAWGVYNMVYQRLGLWFRTPEAYDEEGNFRASMYLRPLAIWAMEYAWDRPRRRL